jgi:Holliday junction DNA helicase RuvA
VIAHLRGKLISKSPGQAIVEAGGVGYDCVISVTTFTGLPATGAEVALHVHTHVREDSLSLFGFSTSEEKRLFERLISVSGVGPKLAMTILSGMPSAADIVGAIRSSDVARLTKIPGVGKKTAERLALELKDKLDAFGAAPARMAAGTPLEEDVLSALVNLGYQRPTAERAVAVAAANGGKSSSFDVLFRQALASLSK